METWFLFLWLLALTVAFCATLFVLPNVPARATLPIVAVFATVARLLPILVYRHSEGLWSVDVNNMQRAADAVLHGRDVYLQPNFGFVHPYLPFQMYVLAVMKTIADATDTPFFVWMRLPQAAADVGTALLLVLAVRAIGGSERAAFRAGLLYALCPLAVAITVYHGQFDAISVFFVFAAFLLVIRPRREHASAVTMGLGTLQKSWGAILLPLFLARLDTWTQRIRYAVISLAVVAVSVVIYIIAFDSTTERIRTKVLRYQSPLPRSGGITLVMDRLPEWTPARDRVLEWWIGHGEWPTMLAVLGVTAFMIISRRELLDGIIAVLCTLFVFAPDGAGYHYLWIVPFGLLARHFVPTAIVVLSITGRYFVLGFFGGGLHYPPQWQGDAATWLIEHEWWFAVSAWATFVVWGLWVALQPRLTEGATSSGPLVRASGALAD
jgi:hypothetical protein